LGDRVVAVELDLEPFRLHDTMDAVNKHLAHRPEYKQTNKGVLVAQVVKSVKLLGEPDESITIVQPNKIYWDNFGWIILGEFLISAQYRRLTMVRLELGSPVAGSMALGEVETNGHTVP
jgi:hypothetical protein